MINDTLTNNSIEKKVFKQQFYYEITFEPEAVQLRPRVAEKMMDTTTRPEN